VNILAASIATSLSINYFGSSGVAFATFLMTILILMFGEIIPKATASRNAASLACALVYPFYIFMQVISPIVKFFEYFTKRILSKMNSVNRYIVSDDELRAMARIGVREGSIEKNEHKLIQNALRFNDIEVYQIMTPRVKMVALDEEKTIRDILSIVQDCSYSRIPTYANNDDNITGIFYVRDILSLNEAEFNRKRLKDMSKTPLFTSESCKIDDLFREFQQKRTHIAIVLDEHGGTAGIITLEDIIEELVGEIDDETDEHVRLFRKINANTILVQGDAEMKVVFDHFEIDDVDDEEFHKSVNGFLVENLEVIPKIGDMYKEYSLVFTIEDANKKMIQKVRIEKQNPPPIQ